MNIFALNADTAKSASWLAIGGSFVLLLLVLKFAKSVITKLLLIILLAAIGVLAFSQREVLTVCINEVKAQAEAGVAIDTTCEFFGRRVTISLPTGS